MGRYYRVELTVDGEGASTFEIGFGEEAATNEAIVPDAIASIRELKPPGGRCAKFRGRASLPVAMALAHAVAHLYGYVACYDPKLQRYVVAISHDPNARAGDLID